MKENIIQRPRVSSSNSHSENRSPSMLDEENRRSRSQSQGLEQATPKGGSLTSVIGQQSKSAHSLANAVRAPITQSVSTQNCGLCGCSDFVAHAFKAGQCNNCYHQH